MIIRHIIFNLPKIPLYTVPARQPTLQGNMVFLMPIRQADAPNQCSSNNGFLSSFKVLLHLHCPSGASQFVTLLAAHTAFVTAAPVSFMPPRSFLPSLRFITPRSQLAHLLQGRASHLLYTQPHTWECTSLYASHPCNTHWVSFRFTTSSIHFGRIQSTRCQ